jgi:prepilin-type N-terminal cleavage/methylation domain-containing protein
MKSSRRRGGYTLIEVLLASTLLGGFAVVAAGAARFMGVATSHLRERTRAATELRMAVEYLLQDLGGAVTATRTAAGALRITRDETVARLADGWIVDADAGIEYRLDADRIVRMDLASGEEVVAARKAAAFVVDEPAVDETTIEIAVGEPSERRTLTLAWKRP